VDAGNRLLRILGIHFVFRFAIFLRDGKDTQRLQRLERDIGSCVERAGANVQIITSIDKSQNERNTDEDSSREND